MVTRDRTGHKGDFFTLTFYLFKQKYNLSGGHVPAAETFHSQESPMAMPRFPRQRHIAFKHSNFFLQQPRLRAEDAIHTEPRFNPGPDPGWFFLIRPIQYHEPTDHDNAFI